MSDDHITGVSLLLTEAAPVWSNQEPSQPPCKARLPPGVRGVGGWGWDVQPHESLDGRSQHPASEIPMTTLR